MAGRAIAQVPIPGTGSEAHDLCDYYAALIGRTTSYSAAMLERFTGLLESGRTARDIRLVLEAYVRELTPAAVFARRGNGTRAGGPGLAWALRPGDKGGFDSILLGLASPEGGLPPAEHPVAAPPDQSERLMRKFAEEDRLADPGLSPVDRLLLGSRAVAPAAVGGGVGAARAELASGPER